MNRRAALASMALSAGSFFAGCTRLEAAATGRYPSIAVEEVRGGSPSDYEFDVEVLKSFTEERPARLAITLRNEADHARTATLASGGQVFGDVTPDDPDSGIVLVPDDTTGMAFTTTGTSKERTIESESTPPAEPIDGCWRLERSITVFHSGKLVPVAPGEAVTTQYSVYSSAHDARCLVPGSYDFSSPGYFDGDERVGFTLRID